MFKQGLRRAKTNLQRGLRLLHRLDRERRPCPPTTSDFKDPAPFPFARQWGMKVALNDARAVVGKLANRRGTGRWCSAGHSLGASLAAAYAAWDFGGRAGFRDLDGDRPHRRWSARQLRRRSRRFREAQEPDRRARDSEQSVRRPARDRLRRRPPGYSPRSAASLPPSRLLTASATAAPGLRACCPRSSTRRTRSPTRHCSRDAFDRDTSPAALGAAARQRRQRGDPRATPAALDRWQPDAPRPEPSQDLRARAGQRSRVVLPAAPDN